jgi:hypothetical protein
MFELRRLASLLLAVASATAIPARAQADPEQLSGLRLLNPRSALVWADRATSFQIWRFDLDPTPRWTSLTIPAALKDFKAENLEDDGLVTVSLQGNTLRLLWVEEGDVVNQTIPYTVTQAESTNLGATWQVFRSTLVDREMAMTGIRQMVMADPLHGWMILQGEGGAGMLPESLATTSDGGRNWRLVPAKEMPIGDTGPQLLIVRSPSEAWFATIEYAEENPLLLSHTADGGRTWHEDAAFPPKSPPCKHCTLAELSIPDDQPHPGKACFEVGLRPEGPNQNNELGQVRYCLGPNGLNWSAAVSLPTPHPAFFADSLSHYSSLPLFADRMVGFSKACAEHKGPGWKNDGNPKGDETQYECENDQTSDGGKTWQPANLPWAIKSATVSQVAGLGHDVWLLVTGGPDADHPVSSVLHSADHGVTWSSPQTPSRDKQGFPPSGPSPDADPTVEHEVTVLVPIKLRLLRSPGKLSVAFDRTSTE